MKFLKSKFFIICASLAVALALSASALAVFGRTDILRGALGTLAKPFSWCGEKVSGAINGFTDVFTRYDDLERENEELKKQLEELKVENYRAEVIEKENLWLKSFLDLKTENPKLALTDARIISRQAGNYSSVITLNRGSIHGVKRNMPVITADGVLGHVSEVGLDWCKVVSILETSSAVGVYVDRSKVSGVAKGDVALRDLGKCSISFSAGADIKMGDMVYTSGGSGSIYPDGLLLGEIVAVTADEATRTLIAEVSAAADISDSSPSEVMIVSGYEK